MLLWHLWSQGLSTKDNRVSGKYTEFQEPEIAIQTKCLIWLALSKKIEFTTLQKWVALGKCLWEFVYLAVEICHRKNFENRQKHQRRRSAWVGQADFGKLELNNRNHSGNCQRLSWTWSIWNTINLKKQKPNVFNIILFEKMKHSVFITEN